MQPSAQGIASLYMGNPGALQQKVQKDQQAKPGIPPDLKNLMALNIVTNEQDAAKRQQAMNALQQMAPGGQPPTVAQSIQAQAKQKLQAQMLQQQRQQQGLQALAQAQQSGQIPEGTPQPEQQPEAGIDQLPVEMSLAGGGIVAFDKGGSTISDTGYEKPLTDEEKAQLAEELRMRMLGEWERAGRPRGPSPMGLTEQDLVNIAGLEAGDSYSKAMRAAKGERAPERVSAPSMVDQIPTGGYPMVTGGERVRGSELERNIQNTLAALPGAAVTKGPTAARMAAAGLAGLLGADRTDAVEPETRKPEPEAQAAKAIPAEFRRAAFTDPRRLDTREGQGLAALAQMESETGRPAAPVRPPVPVVQRAAAQPGQVAPAVQAAAQSEYDKMLAARLGAKPEDARRSAAEAYREAIGAPDTSQIDRLIAELEGRKTALSAPKEGFEAFAEYMKHIAAGGPSRTSAQAGARGALAMEAAEKERKTQQYELTKQQIEAAQKKAETERGFRKDVFAAGQSEYERVFKDTMDALKESGLSEREKRQLASREAEGAKDRANRVAVAGMPTGEERMFKKFSDAWLAKPENKDKTEADAYVAYKSSGLTAKEPQTRAQMIEKFAQDWNKMDVMERQNLKSQGITTREQYINDMMRITGLGAKEGAAAVPIPPNATEDTLKVGTVYQTAKGPAKWNGKAFTPV